MYRKIPEVVSSSLAGSFAMCYVGEFPSGQRGQTVNLLLLASMVQIHPLPPAVSFSVVGFTYGPFINKGEVSIPTSLALMLIQLCDADQMVTS